MTWRAAVVTAILITWIVPGIALAWGPGTHMALAGDVLEMLHLLPAAVAVIVARHRRDFLFGNIAADVVMGKRLSRIKQVCHHWDTGFSMLEEAPTKRGRAFAYGYLAHLAADTVAHNKFLPRQMTLSRTTMSLGHLYWELRADAAVSPEQWRQLRQLLSEVFAEHHANLHARLTDTFLPFGVNWRLFYQMNRFATRQGWRKAIRRWDQVSRWHLPDQLIRDYRAECRQRILDVLKYQRESSVCHEDPNGNAALAYTRHQRRQLRQMTRVGVIAPHIYYEAALGHAPSVRLNVDAHHHAASSSAGV